MASETEICNMALSHLGSGKDIANIDTDESNEADACRIFYDQNLDQVLRDFDWPFARKYATLTLVEADPNDDWGYSYTYPTDCVAVRKLVSGLKPETSFLAMEVGYGVTGRLIFTDEESAVLRYTMRVTDSLLYPSDFVMALSFRLAAYIAPRITAGDPYGAFKRCMELYAIEISRAQASSINEEIASVAPDSEFIRERE